MYRVIKMYGDFEPWWFLEGWEEDVVESQTFDDYYVALKSYKKQWLSLADQFPQYQSRSDLMTIFWDPEDQRWCEECGEYLQQYTSLALLVDNHVIPTQMFRPGYQKHNGESQHAKTCRL